MEDGERRCQSVLAEQGADSSRREDGWRAGAMHYSGIIQTERDHWGKTPQGSSATCAHGNTTRTCPNWGWYQEASSPNPRQFTTLFA
ncbi:hypothetical protein PBY51_008864 [Eleginops maclovinus]|uniref:Uncharacterized protein n=1 Tax=Eleginops maclovinus TaxID=56733 RepID=A0AAN7WXW8_ELEMC|nr:hypothetical protein PBY51_008864 [Eleginops maclovinus]